MRMTQLYEGQHDEISLDEVERFGILARQADHLPKRLIGA
jgi:hypothetical protein